MSEYLKESYEAALRENEELTKRIVSVERERDEIMAMAERREGGLQARLAEVDAALGAWGRNEAGDAATIIRIAKAVGATDRATHRETANDE